MTRNDQPAGALPTPEILASIGEAAYEWQIDTDVLRWSANAAAVLNVSDRASFATGRAFAALMDPESTQNRHDTILTATEKDEGAGVCYRLEYAVQKADGTKIWLEDTGRWFAGANGKPQRAHGVVRAINERRERERKLAQLAQFDPLTGEMNRAHLAETLNSVLTEAERFRSSCGFLLVAINNLGRLNEAYGFETADEVIAQVAKRIRARLRGKDYLGRISGNKFGVVLGTCTPEELPVAAERLLSAVRDEPVLTSVGPVTATATIGGVTAPRHAHSVHEILARAQDALDSARSRRQGSFVAYRPSVERDEMRRENLRATDEIVAALNDRRIALAFEPVVGAESRKLAFYECLMRIYRADGTVAHAHDIIPIAERVGLVRILDHRVLELVIAELVAAPALNASVNVSPASTTDPVWWAGLDAQLRANSGVGERLTLEITETAAIQNIDDARGFVTRAKDLGCRIAIDDFGAGYTSFRNLRKLGVDIVKIDGAFVQNMMKSPDDRAFVRTLVELSRRLGLKTVAEWVQDEASARWLADWGCDYLQGELIGLAAADRPWLTGESRAVSA